jgi:hypothetical protein
VRELAAGLQPIDPPSSMWQAIDAHLAEAEIGDSRRSALWLWVQRGVDGARRNALVFGVAAVAAAILIVLWLPGAGERRDQSRPTAAAATDAPQGSGAQTEGPLARAEQAACAGARTHEEQLLCQMHQSDQRYLEAITQLVREVATERASWTAADAARFDAALAELDHAAQIERLRLAGQPVEAAPANRDPLHSIYRAQIDLLSSAVIAGDFTEAAPWRGAQ